jgi:signal peptidase I
MVALAIFIATSEAIRYWRTRARRGELAVGARAGVEAGVRVRPRARFVALVAVAILAATAARSSLFELYRVESVSMLPTLRVGDQLLVNKVAYGLKLPFSKRRLHAAMPRRGDVIVFDGAAVHDSGSGGPVVKRVIGLPGDVVQFKGDFAAVNGWDIPSCDAGPYVIPAPHKFGRGRLGVEFLDDKAFLVVRAFGAQQRPVFQVPPGQVYVAGDDRVASKDSRSWNRGDGGTVPIDAIVGRVTRVVVGPGGRSGRLDFSRWFKPLAPRLRQPGLDTSTPDQWIDDCLKKPPPSRPPAPATTAALVAPTH